MKSSLYLTLVFTFSFLEGSSQESFFDFMHNMLKINDLNYLKNDHVELKYRHLSDSDSSITIEWLGNNINMALLYNDSIHWSENRRISRSKAFDDLGDSVKSQSIVTFNKMGNIQKLSKKSEQNEYKLPDEEINIEYNDANNITSISLKTEMNGEINLIHLNYSNDQIFPDSIKSNEKMEILITKSIDKDTIIMKYKTQISKAVIDNYKAFLGEDVTDEDLIKALACLSNVTEKYSKIYFLPNNTIYELFYVQNFDGSPQIKGFYNYTKQFKPISKRWYEDGEENYMAYTYYDDGRVKSVTIDENTHNYEYDSENKLIKAHEHPYSIHYVYQNKRLKQEFKVLGTKLIEYMEYNYTE